MALLRRQHRMDLLVDEFRELRGELHSWREEMRADRAERRAERVEDRAFMREVILRSENLHRETLAISHEISRKTDRILLDGDASRNALFKILDRLDGLEPPPAEAS